MSDDLPFNSAGGLSVRYYFPLDAEYVIDPRGSCGTRRSNSPLELRIPIKAGPHDWRYVPEGIDEAGNREASRRAGPRSVEDRPEASRLAWTCAWTA